MQMMLSVQIPHVLWMSSQPRYLLLHPQYPSHYCHRSAAQVKSAEPVLSVALSQLILGERNPPYVWLSLLPIIAGCSLAAMKEVGVGGALHRGAARCVWPGAVAMLKLRRGALRFPTAS